MPSIIASHPCWPLNTSYASSDSNAALAARRLYIPGNAEGSDGGNVQLVMRSSCTLEAYMNYKLKTPVLRTWTQ